METKDRIRLIMEELHMTQGVFADFLGQSPATLSSIFNGRTRPTLNVVDALKAKIPDISIEWLLYGIGDMHQAHPTEQLDSSQEQMGGNSEPMLNFDAPSPISQNLHQNEPSASTFSQGVRNTHPVSGREEHIVIEKDPRRVTEIRVYYDDQTYETFVPAKK